MEGSKRPLLNKEETSCLLNISTRSLDRMVKAGKIVPFRNKKRVRFIEALLPTPAQTKQDNKPAA